MRSVWLLLAVALVLAMPARAAEPPNFTFSPPPPGKIAQSQVVYLAGQAMNSQWRAVTSSRVLGTSNGTTFAQWYLSIYAINDTTYELKYQSPKNGGPLETVTKANGAPMWFPMQEIKIVGEGEFTQQGLDMLVVQSHEMAADCGAATVSVFTTDQQGSKVVPAVSVRNGCELTATVKHGAHDSIVLSGPYYAKDAAMCCPTKPKATATLEYVNGKWVETPNYYELFVGRLPPQ